MTLIISLILITLLYSALAKTIKKHSVIFYLGIYLWQAGVIAYYALDLNESFPEWFTLYFMDVFKRGIFSTVTFIIVMFLGAITVHNNTTKKLMSIRGELSIIASISVICHNIVYGSLYFPALFKHPEIMTTRNIAASVVTIILLIILIPLFVTSFKCVRRKMKAKTWKSLQRFAYPFYILIYVHVMILYTADIKTNLLGIITYTVIYAAYIILRLRKYFLKSKKKSNQITNKEEVK